MSEKDLQIKCNQWIEYTYPELSELFYFHAFQGLSFPTKYKFAIISQAKKLGGLKKNILDFQFNKNNGKYSGLFIELKIESPFKLDDKLKKDEHLEAQHNTILLLLNEGHYACFCWSFEMFKKIVTDYMECKL